MLDRLHSLKVNSCVSCVALPAYDLTIGYETTTLGAMWHTNMCFLVGNGLKMALDCVCWPNQGLAICAPANIVFSSCFLNQATSSRHMTAKGKEDADLLSIPGQALNMLQEVNCAHVGGVCTGLVLSCHLWRAGRGLCTATSICSM